MAEFHEEKLLILTKTYPSPSKKYRETSCVAAINEGGLLRRLFPIPFRLLDGEYQFKRWEWTKARISRAGNDRRPESFRVDTDSITRLSKVGTDEGWSERYHWIESHILENFDALENRRINSGETLGFIQPDSFSLIIDRADSPDWTEEERHKLIQDGLFDSPKVKSRIPLRKIPYDFYYEYECIDATGPRQHKHKITDWEAGALFWNCQNRYGSSWENYFRNRLEVDFTQKKELIFMMGTMHRFPDQWLIVGLIYPPKMEARQRSFLLSAPDA